MNLESREELIAQRGRDIEDVFDEIASGSDMAEERDIDLNPALTMAQAAAEDDEAVETDESTSEKPPKKQSQKTRDGDGDGIVEENAVQEARSEEHTSELQSLMRISYAVFCLKKKKKQKTTTHNITRNKTNKQQK